MHPPTHQANRTPTVERTSANAALAERARFERARDAAWDALSLLDLSPATREQRGQLTKEASDAIAQIERINREAGLVPPAPPSFGARPS